MNEAEIVAGIWSGIKTLGSLGGLVSAAFLLWDRATKTRPYARILRGDGSHVPEENRVILRVYNPSNRLMLARVDIAKRPQDLYLSADDETFQRAGIEGIMSIQPDGFVDVGAERQDGWKNLSRDETVRAVYRWKYAQPLFFRHWRTKCIVIVKQDFDAISPRPW